MESKQIPTTPPFNYTQLDNKIVANVQLGSNLGERIRAADEKLGTKLGEIHVYDGGNIDISVRIRSNHRVIFHAGNYYTKVAKPFLMENYSSLIGENWDVIFHEDPTGLIPFGERDYQMVATTATRIETGKVAQNINNVIDGGVVTSPAGSYGAADKAGVSHGIRIEGIQFKGVRKNQLSDAVPTIGLFNSHNSVIRNCWFNGTSAFAAQFGANAAHADYALINASGQFSKNCRFEDNLLERLVSQNLAVISAENIQITGNTFLNPGKSPIEITNIVAHEGTKALITFAEEHDLTSNYGVQILGAMNTNNVAWDTVNTLHYGVTVPSRTTAVINVNVSALGTYKAASGKIATLTNDGTCLDFESSDNNESERHINPLVANNIFDFREATYFCNALVFAAPLGNRALGGMIINNQFQGHETGRNYGSMKQGIAIGYSTGAGDPQLASLKGMTVANNQFRHVNSEALYISGTQHTIENNTMIDCGINGGLPSMHFVHLTNSDVINNKVYNPTGHFSWVKESKTNTGNLYENNKIGRKSNINGQARWEHHATSTVTHCRYIGNQIWGSGNEGRITESANSNNNFYDNNLYGASGAGEELIGANSKIGTTKYSDGRTVLHNSEQSEPPSTEPAYTYVADPAAAWQTTRILDLDADLITNVANGGQVAIIPDKVAGAAYPATQADASYQGKLIKQQINNHAAVYLDSSYRGYDIPQLPANMTAITIAFVGKQPANTNFAQPRRLITATDRNFLLSINGQYQMYHANATGGTVASNVALTANTPYLMICEMDANGYRYYKGATLIGSKSNTAVGNIPRNLKLGLNDFLEVANGYLSRVIVFSTVLAKGSGNDFENFIAAMGTRYGTPLT